MGKKVNNSLTNVKEKRNPRKKRVDGSYDFKVNKKTGGSICGRATGQGKGAARST